MTVRDKQSKATLEKPAKRRKIIDVQPDVVKVFNLLAIQRETTCKRLMEDVLADYAKANIRSIEKIDLPSFLGDRH